MNIIHELLLQWVEIAVTPILSEMTIVCVAEGCNTVTVISQLPLRVELS